MLVKLRSNFVGTEFITYDDGLNPKQMRPYDSPDSVRTEMASILFQSNVFGSRGPRKMTILVPHVNKETQNPLQTWKPKNNDESMLTHFRNE
eukprot:UN22646